MRRNARVDGNHRALLDVAKQLGGVVIDCRSLGQGNPDAFVFINPLWKAVEIKMAEGTLTAAQERLHRLAPILIWRDRADVLAAFGVASVAR